MSVAPAPARRDTVDPESPWLGLRSFTEETRAYFFGRDAELQDLFERVVHKPLTVLFGQSGLGKTSLVQAALVPRLRERGYLPVPLRLDHGADAPALETQVLAALRAALLANGRADLARFPEDIESLWLLLHDPPHGFVQAPGAAVPPPASSDPRPWSSPAQPVFLFDQFEEIFTLGERPERRELSLAFRDALACLVENRPPAALRARLEEDDDLADRLAYSARPAKVLLTLREDFLHVLERWRRQMPSLMDNRLELRLLTGPQSLQAVVEPGRRRGADRPPIVSEDTGAAIVRFVAGAAPDVPLAGIDAVPPLLSLICAELNARRFGPDGTPREEIIRPEQLPGRSADILQGFYAGSFDGVPEAVRRLVEDRLLSADGFRESLALDSAHRALLNDGLAEADARAAIANLVDRRLLVVEERGGVRRVELTHDVLTGVARASRDQRNERDAAARAERQARIAEEDRDRAALARRRDRRRLLLLSVLLGLAMVFGVVSFAQSRAARRATRAAESALADARAARQEAEARKAEAETSKATAETAARRATQARDEAEKLVRFMTFDLRDKLSPIGRLDLLDALNSRVRAYYAAIGTEGQNDDTVRLREVALTTEGDVLLERRDFKGALRAYREALATAESLATKDPANTLWQLDLSMSVGDVGIALWKLEDFPGSLEQHRRQETIAETLAKAEPDKSKFQVEWATSLRHLGDVLRAQNDLPGAVANYQAAAEIFARLSVKEPEGGKWLSRFASLQASIGDLRKAQHDLPAAVASYGVCLDARERLVKEFPANGEWQRQLELAHDALAALRQAQNDLPGALASYRASLGVAERLARANPADANRQRDLALSHNEVGAVLQAQGDLPGALERFRDSVAILEGLTRTDAANVTWLRDLAISRERVADVLQARNDLPGALAGYRAEVALWEQLARLEPAQPAHLRGLSVARNHEGPVLLLQGDPAAALATYRASLAAMERCVAAEPANPGYQGDLAYALLLAGTTTVKADPGQRGEARALLERGALVLRQLRDQPGGIGSQRQSWLDECEKALAQLDQGAPAAAPTVAPTPEAPERGKDNPPRRAARPGK